jgi:hypothetical protein
MSACVRAAQTTTYNAKTGQSNTFATASVGNDHYADANGNVYKNTGSGWQQHTSSGWQATGGDTSWANHEQQARSTGQDRFSSFNSGNWGDRFGGESGGGGFGDRFGGGGFGVRSEAQPGEADLAADVVFGHEEVDGAHAAVVFDHQIDCRAAILSTCTGPRHTGDR